jgi:DNA invertase Pin-like site-specific DNA recombinase
MRAAIYARVSTQDQNTLALQIKALKKYAKQRQWGSVANIARKISDEL